LIKTPFGPNKTEGMNSEEKQFDAPQSTLRASSIFGMFCVVLGAKDLLAWTEFISPQSGWLVTLAGSDWMQPMAGLAFMAVGAALTARSVTRCFSVRDRMRRNATRWAVLTALVSGAALTYGLETLVPSRDILIFGNGVRLPTDARRAGVIGLVVAAGGLAVFLWMRRRDVGFWRIVFPLQRDNEIWRMTIKTEVAFRARPKNEEACAMLRQRTDFLQAEIGAKFDKLCLPLIKESADLSKIDSTARLQMDVGHIFKRYADFHAHLAETRQNACEELMEETRAAIEDVLDNQLTGQSIRADDENEVKILVSYPVLEDNETLKRRRAEWDETMRSVVSIGAATGNQIIGDWIDRAVRGDISAEDIPAAAQLIRSLAQGSESSGAAIPVSAAPALGFSETAKQLHEWIGDGASVEDPNVAGRVRAFFSERRLSLANCPSPEVSAETLMQFLRSEFGGILTLGTIAAALARPAN
jgi:hypothetical protein